MELYGSLINRLHEVSNSTEPEVGMGVTEICYSDRHAYTVVRVASNGKRIWVQRDKAIRVDSGSEFMTDAQEYKYEQNKAAGILELRLNKRGQWKLLHDPRGNTFMVGGRNEYYDFGF